MVKNQPKPTLRTCTDCKLTKPLTEYTPIAHKQGWYGRCRVCRARRARERYRSDPVWREKQKARAARNRHRSDTSTAVFSTLTTNQLADGGRDHPDDWDILDEQLGPPGSPRADQRTAELTAAGWQLVGVRFQSGVWRFRRPKQHSGQ
jgi:hypothetical protein